MVYLQFAAFLSFDVSGAAYLVALHALAIIGLAK